MLVVVACLAVGGARADEASQETAVLRARVEDLRNERGQLRVGVFDSAKGFPKRREGAVVWRSVPADAEERVVEIALPPGRYAVVVLHDEDADKKLDANWLGVPTEGYGVTNNPKPRMRAATFKEAAFDLAAEGAEKTVSIQYF